MTDNPVQVVGSDGSLIQNIGQIGNNTPYFENSNLELNMKPSLITGILPSTNKSLFGVPSIRSDSATKDLGLGIYPIPINSILLFYNTGASKVSATIYTADSTLRTFITGVFLSCDSTVACDNTSTRLDIVPVGGTAATTYIIYSNKQTLTSTHDNINLSFPLPIEIQKGSVITVTNSWSVGASPLAVIIFGYKTN